MYELLVLTYKYMHIKLLLDNKKIIEFSIISMFKITTIFVINTAIIKCFLFALLISK